MSTGDGEEGMKKVPSLHAFSMDAAFYDEDEGTAKSSASSVVKVMDVAKSYFPGVIPAHRLAKSVDKILTDKAEYTHDNTLLVTSFCGDDVNRDIEDELRMVYGQNFNLGGIAGFPFGGATSFGTMAHSIPKGGSCLVVFGPHVGVDFDGHVGKVNRRGHEGSGACCNIARAAHAYVKSVKAGQTIHSPSADDPIDAQQVWVNNALLQHADRLENAPNPEIELPHTMFDCQDELMQRLLAKSSKDVSDDGKIALLGGIIVNTPPGTPDYFLPKKFELRNNKGEVLENLLDGLAEEGGKDPKAEMLKRSAMRKGGMQPGMIPIDIKP